MRSHSQAQSPVRNFMRKSGWHGTYAFLAFGLIAALLLGYLLWTASAQLQFFADSAKHEATLSRDDAKREFRDCSHTTNPFECMEAAANASREAKIAEADLAAQQSMSQWALWMFWVSLAGTTSTAFGIYFVWVAYLETRTTNDLVRRDSRPWLDFELVGLEVSRPSENPLGLPLLNILPKIEISNEGKSPAIEICISLRSYQGQSFNPSDFFDEFIAKGNRGQVAIRNTIFPAKKWTSESTSFLVGVQQTSIISPDTSVSMWLALGVTYKDSFGNNMFASKVYVGSVQSIWIDPWNCADFFRELTFSTKYT